MILFFLPWLDHSPVKSIRYRPTWHKYFYAVFIINFLILGYLGTQAPNATCQPDVANRHRDLSGFFFLMPIWSRLGTFKPVPDRVTFQPSIEGHRMTLRNDHDEEADRYHCFILTCAVAFAAEGGYKLDHAPDRINDMAALQNGAKLFVNYCMDCHSANSMRYNKLTDIGLTDDQIQKNLLFTADKVGELMTSP